MRQSKPMGGEQSHRPAGKARGNRSLCAFESWIPVLMQHALGRQPGADLRFSEKELYSLVRSVKVLSRGFTRSRELTGTSYFNNPDSLAAYLLFFWPISYEQTRAIFTHFLPVPPGVQGVSVLDVGGGPGPSACAALDSGAGRIVVADADRAALDTTRALIRSRGAPVQTCVWNAERSGRLPGGPYDVVIFSHLLNELWKETKDRIRLRADLVEESAERLSGRGRIIIIEPALLSTTRDLLYLRDRLLSRGFPVLNPCLRQDACPCVMPGADRKATCHADIQWRPPPWYVRLAHRARIGKESLRFSFLVLGRPGELVPAFEKSVFRVVSERMLSKSGRMRYMICNGQGRFSLSTKPAGKEPWLKTFLGLNRYDLVRVQGIEKRENGIGLTRESGLQKIGR